MKASMNPPKKPAASPRSSITLGSFKSSMVTPSRSRFEHNGCDIADAGPRSNAMRVDL